VTVISPELSLTSLALDTLLKYSHILRISIVELCTVQCNFNFYSPLKLNWYMFYYTNLRNDSCTCSGYTIACFSRSRSYRLYTFTLWRTPSTIQLLDLSFLSFGHVFHPIPFCQGSELRWNTQFCTWKPCSNIILTLRTRRAIRFGL